MQKLALPPLALFLALTQTPFARAQLTVLPPSSLYDGIGVQPIGGNQGAAHWENASTLGAYRNATGNPLGLTWQTTMHSDFASGLDNLENNAGTLRAIFLGASNSSGNDFGYTLSGAPEGPDSFTLMSGLGATNLPSPAAFGNFADFSFSIGEPVQSFDFWLNCDDGVYSSFQPAASGAVKWASTPLYVSTWLQSLNGGLGAYADVATFLLCIEETNTNPAPGAPADEFVFALQVYVAEGGPLTPVPEPATYGLLGTLGLLGLAFHRRRCASRRALLARAIL